MNKSLGLLLALWSAPTTAGDSAGYNDHTMDAMKWLKENTPAASSPVEQEVGGTLIIDVRTKEEYDTGHLEGAVLLQEIEMDLCYEKYREIQQYVAVYCYTKPYRSTPIAQHFSEKYPGLRIIDLGGLAYMEGAHLVYNGTDNGAVCMKQPTSKPTLAPGETGAPSTAATRAPVASPYVVPEASETSRTETSQATSSSSEASTQKAGAGSGDCKYKFAIGAVLVLILGVIIYACRKRKTVMRPAQCLEATKANVQTALPLKTLDEKTPAPTALDPTPEEATSVAIQKVAIEDASQLDVEKAEVMSLETSEELVPSPDACEV